MQCAREVILIEFFILVGCFFLDIFTQFSAPSCAHELFSLQLMF